MTNEYKYNLLKYLTNKIDDETGIDIPYFRNKEIIANDLKTTLDSRFSQYNIRGQVISPKSDNIIIYGNYDFSSRVGYKKGFIVILNKNCEIVNILTQFNTGTPFSQLIALNVDENGLIYGIDNPGVTNENTTYRIILLNNFINSNNNEVILRQSYLFPTEYNNVSFAYSKSNTNIKKAENEANYYLVGERIQSGSINYEMILITLTINVGSENEWNIYANGRGTRYGDFYDFIISKVDTTNVVTIMHGGSNGISKMYFNGENITDTVIISSGEISNIRVVNENLFYYNSTEKLYKYNNGQILEISRSNYINLLGINVISYYLEQEYDAGNINVYLGIYDGDNYTEELLYTEQTYFLEVNIFYGYNIFNLNKICVQIGDNAYIDSIVISNGYDGLSFNNKNSLNPKSVELYDENEKIIYARNLYNKTINNNITEATVEIPNTYLNNDNIAIQDLLSVNNNIMVHNENLINKNIYETLYINFFNTIRMINKNNVLAPIQNIPGAIRINDSISNLIDYDNAKLTKARINYNDNTSEIIEISYRTVTNARQIYFSLYVNKEIKNIELISDDELTIYNTITGNFETGKTYNIKQLVTVEGVEILIDLLYYNNEIVQYNGEDIQIVE